MNYKNERVDYIKWGELHTPQTLHAALEKLARQQREMLEATGEDLDYGYVFSGKTEAGFGLYLFEVRGASADTYLTRYAHTVHWHNLRRVDYRVEVDCNDATFKMWRANKSAEPDRNRNYNAFNTRKRAKTDDRDRGGYGLAIGSLKSAHRITLYQEQPGTLAIEKQFRGKGASVIGLDMKALCDAKGWGLQQYYEALLIVLRHAADDFSFKLFDMDFETFAAYFESDTSHERLPPLPTAHQAAEIVLQHCNHDGLKAIQLLLDLLL